MRKSRFSEKQIVGIPKDHAAGEPTGTLFRRHGISQQTAADELAVSREWQALAEDCDAQAVEAEAEAAGGIARGDIEAYESARSHARLMQSMARLVRETAAG